MDTSKSAKRVARVAKQSAKTKVRTQRGLLFPVSMAAVIVLGSFLVVYARQSKVSQSITNVAPTLNDKWSIAYGVYHCDKWIDPFKNTNDIVDGVATGVNTSGDGLISYAPKTEQVTGKKATFGKFMDAVGIKKSGDKIELPESAGSFTNLTDKCGDKEGRWKLAYFADANQSSAPQIFVTDFENVRILQDRAAITLAFVAEDTDLQALKPPSVAELAKLDVSPTTTTIAGDPSGATTTVADAGATTTVAGATASGTTTTTLG